MLRRHPILTVLGIAAVLVAIAIGVDALTGGHLRLEADFRVQEWMAQQGKATTLEIESLPPFKLFLHPDDKVVTTWILADGIWESNETHWTMQLVREGDTYVDLGANIGYYTVLASKLVGDTGKVFAFEPDPVNFSILERNVQLNGLTNVVLEQKAVSNEPGTLKLFLNETNKGDHRIFQTEAGQQSVEVEAVRLDDYFADYDKPIDFVKIDTQGAEGVILEGMDGILRKNEDIVMAIEFFPLGLSGLNFKAEDVVKFLRGHDLMFFDIGPGGNKINNFSLVNEEYLARYTIKNEYFTNLLVVKGQAGYEKLRLALESAKKAADNSESPEVIAARKAVGDYVATIWSTHGRTVNYLAQ